MPLDLTILSNAPDFERHFNSLTLGKQYDLLIDIARATDDIDVPEYVGHAYRKYCECVSPITAAMLTCMCMRQGADAAEWVEDILFGRVRT